MKVLPISLIVTCYNEQENVASWCDTLLSMNCLPAELIVADSESVDNTISILFSKLSNSPIDIIILEGKCSISAGRNKAIRASKYDLFAITDFGILFTKDWLGKIYGGLLEADWVGGYYKLIYQNSIQESYCRLFDKPVSLVDERTFLPSSRSFGLTRTAFDQTNGYDEALIIGEDTDIVLRLRESHLRYLFVSQALVNWYPRKSIKSLFKQHYKYAYWDGIAKQNSGRKLHMIFLIAMFLSILASIAFPISVLTVIFLFFMLFIKVTRNVKRNGYSPSLKPLDLLVYVTTIFGSALGYGSGILRAAIKYR